MVRAYVFIKTQLGMAGSVVRDVAGMEGVLSADAVTGAYDVIARVEADDIRSLGEMIVANIQGVNGVWRTATSIVVEF